MFIYFLDSSGRYAKDRLSLREVEDRTDHALAEDDVDGDGFISWVEYIESQKAHKEF
jgi:hypothetical protein